MRIISWNCQGVFRKKADSILSFAPDILVVQECEHPDKILNSKATDFLWFGDNQNKGLGIFSFSNYRFTLLDCHTLDYKFIVPISVTGG